ncbi:MAG: hypothetical protein ACHP79_19265, partial [Terriglobales bacterium]
LRARPEAGLGRRSRRPVISNRYSFVVLNMDWAGPSPQEAAEAAFLATGQAFHRTKLTNNRVQRSRARLVALWFLAFTSARGIAENQSEKPVANG